MSSTLVPIPTAIRHLPREMRRIIVVEDDIGICAIAHRVLEGAGFEVVTISSMSRFRQLIETVGKFDLAVLDIKLDDGTGFDAARYLRALQPDIPILFITGYCENDIVGSMPENSFMLTKPFDFLYFLQVVKTFFTEESSNE